MSLFRSSSVHATLLDSQNARRPPRPTGSALHAHQNPMPFSGGGSNRAPATEPLHSAPAPAPATLAPGADDGDGDDDDDDDGVAPPTYYDVLKCRAEFAAPSAFLARPMKPVHSGGSAYPWASQPLCLTPGGGSGQQAAGESRHRLRRSTGGGGGSAAETVSSSSASSSVFAAPFTDNALPPSVFRLPGPRHHLARRAGRARDDSAAADPWALAGMTAGGRALRRADQVVLSPFDCKVTISS
ncbi:hypothetical protein H4217_005112 [Coemansia sp. RSA 1939]|nr:hypothetical protein H4217_005112 [Coemansia sp. RSA 1939]KAJ2609029.1 hypothetical protein EV177_004673 [Coemansia sp. RSA 1804]